jgi:hypothetical protein
MSKKYNYLICFLLLVSFTLSQCKCGSKKPDAPKVDFSKTDVTFFRFDQEFQQVDTTNTKAHMLALQKKYGSFYDIYVHEIMRFGEARDFSDNIYYNMNQFFIFKDMVLLHKMVQKKFPNTEENNEEIRKAFTYCKYYLPNMKLPNKVAYCMSGLNVGAFTVDTEYVGIGLDMYMNNDTFYNQLFDNYIVAKLRKEMMCQNVLKAVYNNQYNDPYNTNGNLIDNIINVGKQQYFLSKVLPHIEPAYQFGYSDAQLNWCNDNEKQIWKHIADKDLFYTESDAEIRHFIGEQPNTVGMPIESPGNIGAWIGYRIVSAYMEQMNNKPTLDQLMLTDPKTILAKSKYKP